MDDLFLTACILSLLFPFMLIFLTNPKGFILLFIILSPIINAFWSFEIYQYSVVDIYSGIFPLLSVAIIINKSGEDNWQWGKYHKYFVLMLLAYFIPMVSLALQGESVISPLESFAKVFCGYASYLLTLNLLEEEGTEQIVKALLYAVLITMTMVVFQLITGWGTYYAKYHFIQGIYHDPGQYTRIALIGIVILLPTFRLVKEKHKYFFKFLILALCIITLGLSISRSVVFSAAGILVVYSLLWRKFTISLLIILVGVGLYFSSPVIQATYKEKTDKEISFLREQFDRSKTLKGSRIRVETLASGRIGMWGRNIYEFRHSKLFEQVFGKGKGIGPHGEFFNLLRSVGVYGLVIAAIFYFKLLVDSFKAVIRDKNNLPATYSFLFAITIVFMSLGSSPLTNFYLQIVFFAFVALTEKSQKSKIKQTSVSNQIEGHSLQLTN